MATAIKMIHMSSSSSEWVQFKNVTTKKMSENSRVIFCSVSASTASTSDSYRTLRIRPDASKSEVKKAFRQLALKYHPDVCRENNGVVQFHHINEAYDIVMSQLREQSNEPVIETNESYDEVTEEAEIEINDPDLDLWEEWMGWEGAGIRDYTSHINPYL